MITNAEPQFLIAPLTPALIRVQTPDLDPTKKIERNGVELMLAPIAIAWTGM